jgi:hypothetical protein
MKPIRLARVVVSATLLTFLHTVSASPPKSYTRDQLKQYSATVASIDPGKREIVLEAPDGKRQEFVAGPEVRNFAQVKTGDRVVLSYYEGLAAAIKPAGTQAQAPEERVEHESAPAGAKPGAGAASSRSTTVKIDSVDTSLNSVTFKRSDGITRTVAVHDPKAQEFIRQLKPGDAVEITYTEAVAVKVKPAQ